ncbi:MAG: hypothetical protein HRU26_01460 [Psychroserpens sp.]|nr:hypothetical protein [Psychroserpens sp.]
MQKPRICLFIVVFQLCFTNVFFGQEIKTLIQESFAIRDFVVTKDSVFYIKKRDAVLLDKTTKRSRSFFIGGYGLEISTSQKSSNLITVANELVDTVSSVRFYNKNNKKFEDEFYNKDAKILDFLNIEDASLFVLSLTNQSIVFYDYQDRPEFIKTIEIKTNSLSRKLIYKDKILYFATDSGKIFKYNFHNYEKTLLFDAKAPVTQFEITPSQLFYTTIKGGIFKVDLNSGSTSRVDLENNFISALLFQDDQLVCGSWNGTVYIIDTVSFTIKEALEVHKRAVLTIKQDNTNLYSSSLDKTIKSWRLKN